MRISDWSSDVCSSDLKKTCPMGDSMTDSVTPPATSTNASFDLNRPTIVALLYLASFLTGITALIGLVLAYVWKNEPHEPWEPSHYRSEEHTSEPQSLMRTSSAVLCLTKTPKLVSHP